MSERRSSRFLIFSVCGALAAALAASAQAAIVITTNQNGADAEVREEETGTPTGTPPAFPGVNRGSSFELATRLRDQNDPNNPLRDRSSAIFLKFDISGISAADLLANPYAALRLNVGAVNVVPSRQSAPSPADPNTTIEMEFKLRGLTNFALNNWQENTITYYNAPGITPDATLGPVNPGEYDFNSDLPELGTFKMTTVAPQNHLPVGSPVDYREGALGPLHQLISSAVAAGEDFITLVVHHGLDGYKPNDPATQPLGSTPESMLDFNYLFIPKDITVLNNSNGQPNHLNDTNYDPDTTDMNPGGPSPFLNASNATGAFSPKLILSPVLIPEPGSISLVVISGLLAAASLRRRR
jgi:hypothetical protein